jgi:hypothetical protein
LCSPRRFIFKLPARIVETEIVAVGSAPVRIDAYTARYGSISAPTAIPFLNVTEKDTNLMGAAYEFTNVSGKAITAIRFAFRELDAFGEGPSYAIFVNDWNGDVAPGQSFRGNKAQGYSLTGGDRSSSRSYGRPAPIQEPTAPPLRGEPLFA